MTATKATPRRFAPQFLVRAELNPGLPKPFLAQKLDGDVAVSPEEIAESIDVELVAGVGAGFGKEFADLELAGQTLDPRDTRVSKAVKSTSRA